MYMLLLLVKDKSTDHSYMKNSNSDIPS